MEMSGNTVLVTGGASGIGLAFASRFLEAGNEVIIIGRREEKLIEAQQTYPALHIKVCDVSQEQDRLQLADWVVRKFPDLNVLVNNAGIQQQVNLQKPKKDWNYYQKELAINAEAPIHLALLLLPNLMKQERSAIINVSSGLALRPGVWAPIYSATKAALHAFTQSLRLQLADTAVDVIEVLPPAVNTDLGGAGVHAAGAPLADFADSIFERMGKGDIEIGYGDSEKRLHATKEEINEGMEAAWHSFRERNPDF